MPQATKNFCNQGRSSLILFKEYQEYWSKSLNKDKFDSSVGNKLSLYSEVKNEVRFESYLDLIKNVKTRVAVTKMRIFLPLATY